MRVHYLACVTVLLLGLGCATHPPRRAQGAIEIDRDVHFPVPDGATVLVTSGQYNLVDAGDGRLRLVARDGLEFLLPTTTARHNRTGLKSPTAVSRTEGKNEHSVAILFPWGVALESRGTYSGGPLGAGKIRQRGFDGNLDSPDVLNLTIAGTAFASNTATMRRRDWGRAYVEVMNPAVRETANAEPAHIWVYAPLHLPHGAVIRSFSVYYHDNDPYGDVVAMLYRKEVHPHADVSSRNGRVIATYPLGETYIDPAAELNETKRDSQTVDNRSFAYMIAVRLPARWVPPDIAPRDKDLIDTPNRYHWEARLSAVRIRYTAAPTPPSERYLSIHGGTVCSNTPFLRRRIGEPDDISEGGTSTASLNANVRAKRDGRSSSVDMYAPVHLPHGAVIRELTFHGYDSDQHTTMMCGLYRKSLDPNASEAGWVALLNDCDQPSQSTAADNALAVVDNTRYAYSVEISVPNRWINPDIPPLEANYDNTPDHRDWYWESRVRAIQIAYNVGE